MSLTTLCRDDELAGIVHHCIPISERERPPIDLFARSAKAQAGYPLIKMCSYCLRIFESGDNSWIEAEQYYRQGGSQDVAISHGICPDCRERIVQPIQKFLD